MMREIPFGADLLDTARDILRSELLPGLAPGQRQQALMIANAMAIARRQLDDGDIPERRELSALDQVMEQLRDLPSCDGADLLQSRLIARNRRLCQAIRAGDADPGTALHDGVLALLLEVSQAKVAQSNPRYLEQP